MSTASAMRSFSCATAASTWRSSLIINSMMSADESLSTPRLAGLMASVGNCCHLDCGMTHPVPTKRQSVILAPPRRGVKPPPGRPAALEGQSGLLVDEYVNHLRVERRLAGNSVESYARDLTRLLEFAAGRGKPVERLGRAELEELVREMLSGGLSPRSAARAVACVRGFYRFLARNGRLDASPADDLHAPRAWPSLPKFLSTDEVDLLMAQPDPGSPAGLRDKALLELLYATGMRVSELVGLRPTDVNLSAGYLTCLGKGGKQRLVPIGDEAASWVERYQRGGRPAIVRKKTTPRLFVNLRGGPLSRVGFWKILKGYGAAGRAPARSEPARAPAFLRDAPAGARRRPAGDPDDARARRPVDHADLHAHPGYPHAGALRSVPSPGVIARGPA